MHRFVAVLPAVAARDDASLDRLMNGHVKRALNLTKTWGKQRSKVFSLLFEDFMKPVTEVGTYTLY